jgi:signal peptidase II
VVVALDQATKAIIESALVPGERVHLALGFALTNVHNRGAAFGIFAGGQKAVIVVSVAAILLIGLYLAWGTSHRGRWLAAGLLAGGALGNLADRIRIDSVTDFIDPPAWPAFNLADIAIVAGVAILVLGLSAGRDQS